MPKETRLTLTQLGIRLRLSQTLIKLANGFKKRVLWLKTEEQYSQTLEIQFTQYNVELLDGYQSGERVRVMLGIAGRKNEKDGKERVFNSLNGFGISKLS